MIIAEAPPIELRKLEQSTPGLIGLTRVFSYCFYLIFTLHSLTCNQRLTLAKSHHYFWMTTVTHKSSKFVRLSSAPL